jgi:hypothetical protein
MVLGRILREREREREKERKREWVSEKALSSLRHTAQARMSGAELVNMHRYSGEFEYLRAFQALVLSVWVFDEVWFQAVELEVWKRRGWRTITCVVRRVIFTTLNILLHSGRTRGLKSEGLEDDYLQLRLYWALLGSIGLYWGSIKGLLRVY